MGAYQDPLQGAVVGILTVMCALRNGTLDTLVCMAAHSQFLLFSDSAIVFLVLAKKTEEMFPIFSPPPVFFLAGN